jgi:hypothetical protein
MCKLVMKYNDCFSHDADWLGKAFRGVAYTGTAYENEINLSGVVQAGAPDGVSFTAPWTGGICR